MPPRSGQVLLLIIGDGIEEGAEALASYLQLHVGIHAGLALVELSIWQLGSGEQLVISRISLRTTLVERGIVRVDVSGMIRVDPPGSDATGKIVRNVKPETLTELEFYQFQDQERHGATTRIECPRR
jgi:hypothetical protein